MGRSNSPFSVILDLAKRPGVKEHSTAALNMLTPSCAYEERCAAKPSGADRDSGECEPWCRVLAGSGVRKTETRTVTSVATSSAGTDQPIQAADVEAANISLGDCCARIAVDANASRIYVERGQIVPGASSLNFSLTVIDASSNTVVANVSLPPILPTSVPCSDLAVDDSTGMVYAIFAREIVEVNGSTDAVTGEVPLSPTLTFAFICGLTATSLDSSTHVLWGPVTAQQPGESGDKIGSVMGVNVLTGSVVENVSLGFAPLEVAVDPYTGMVSADGCMGESADLCNSQQLAIIKGNSGSLVTTVSLDSPIYSPIAMDPSTDIVHIAAGSQLVAVNGTSGNVIFKVYPQTCWPFSIAVISSLDQAAMVPVNYNYLLVYDGATGTLVNMYSFSPDFPSFAGYDANTGELYVFVGISPDLIALHDVQATGNVNTTLIDVGCGAA